MRRRLSVPRLAAVATAGAAIVGLMTMPGIAAAAPTPPGPGTAPVPAAAAVPGAVQPKVVAADTRVHIVKSLSGPSCTGYSSQIVTPSTIRVMVHGATAATDKIVTVPFLQYVQHVLPHEWIASWDGESLKAGAVAVKSYGWFWITHYGGYLDTRSPANCFDVTDDSSFQVYGTTTNPRTDDAVQATWNVITRKNANVIQASYICTLPYDYNHPPNCATQGAKETCGSGANSSQLSQYGSQACAEAGKSYQTILTTYYGPSLELATTASRARLLVPNDFDFQGHSSPAVFDPPTGNWTTDGGAAVQFGTTGDIPTVTNRGDAWATIGVFRPSNGTWYVHDQFSGSIIATQWGTAGDIPVQAHYQGISKPSVLAVFRPSLGRWYRYGSGPSVQYGTSGDIPVPGHYSGTSATDFADNIAVFRPSEGTWYMLNVGKVQYGTAGDIPVPGDYNGNGSTDLAVYRPSTQTWWIRGSASVKFGAPGDIPVTGDFDGDGRTDIAVYRPSNSTWYIHGHGVQIPLGVVGDVPVGKAPYTD